MIPDVLINSAGPDIRDRGGSQSPSVPFSPSLPPPLPRDFINKDTNERLRVNPSRESSEGPRRSLGTLVLLSPAHVLSRWRREARRTRRKGPCTARGGVRKYGIRCAEDLSSDRSIDGYIRPSVTRLSRSHLLVCLVRVRRTREAAREGERE